jgi:MFS transporter, DHA3 family, tetracycline resistance protein
MARPNAGTVYLVYGAAGSFFFRMMATIFSVFLILRLGLSPLQLVLMGTALEASYFLFELPTGIVADTTSRKLSVVIGLIGTGVGFLVLAFATTFWMALLSQVVWGVFATFQSGADVAWVTDEVGEEAAHSYYLREGQIGHVASVVGIAASVGLAVVDLRLPIVVAGVGTIAIGVAMLFLMREDHFVPRPRAEGERLHHGLISTFKEGVRAVRAHHVLLLILATAMLHGASTEGFDRLSDLHLLVDVGLPSFAGLNQVLWFGVLDGVALLFGLAAITYVKRKTHLGGHRHVARMLMWIDIVLVVVVVVFGLTASFAVALVAFWFVGALRSMREPIFIGWINQGLDPQTRATINSMGSQADAVGQSAGGPALGVIANRSVPISIVISGLVQLPSVLLYVRAIRRGTVGTVAPSKETLELQE